MATVLITQCLQRDFVDPIGPHDPLPNLLHVGHREATRLLGPEPSAGPLAQLIDWAHGLAPDAIDLVHIRDWHDPGDPAQREHLQRFGAHCIKGSHGARLVLGMDERAGAASNEVIVDSLTLNDLEGTDLVQQLERIRQAHGGAPLRVGVVGVWTEAKVSFLLYELKTRLAIDELATCSALTASDSRAQHFNALSQLEKILGVRCFESPAEFVGWLRPGTELDLPRQPIGMEPRLRGSGIRAALQPRDRAIVGYLFRDSLSPPAAPSGAPALRRPHPELPRSLPAAETAGAGGSMLARRSDHPHSRSRVGTADGLGRIGAHRGGPARYHPLPRTALSGPRPGHGSGPPSVRGRHPAPVPAH